MTTIIFLHVPKTAGQTIHHQLARAVGIENVSPVRTHTQAVEGRQMPPGYRLHSGHIDWTELDSIPRPRFVFSVLREPRERLASFYFYLRQTARDMPSAALSAGERPDLQALLSLSADDYFFSGDEARRRFVAANYDNFFCSYFATRRMTGRGELDGLALPEILRRARAGLAEMDGIYWTEGLHLLERDLKRKAGVKVRLTDRRNNQGPLPQDQPRWPALMDLFESDAARRRMEDFVARDEELFAPLPRPGPPPLWLRLRDQLLASMSR